MYKEHISIRFLAILLCYLTYRIHTHMHTRTHTHTQSVRDHVMIILRIRYINYSKYIYHCI